MDQKPPLTRATLREAAAFSIHIFTASGAGCALLALMAAVGAAWTEMFVWLGVAVVIDGIDGTFARRLRVAELLPRWSGDLLDFVVDYTTYVFVPAYAMVASGLLPASLALALGLIVTVTGALYFADRRMKTSDSYFRGFPALWNVVAFYLFLLRPEPWLGVALVIVLCGLSFVPFPFLHPLRVRRFRALNILLLLAWSALGVVTIAQHMEPGAAVKLALVALAIYFLTAGLFRTPVARDA
jgi:phosphatidylcholine synthase